MSTTSEDEAPQDIGPLDFDEPLRQRGSRQARNDLFDGDSVAGLPPVDPLEMRPVESSLPRGRIPNTPGAVSLISFALGGICFLSLSVFLSKLSELGNVKGSGWWWATPQLGFFTTAWSLFHWAEFSVTAGWNREKCSTSCKLLP